MYHSSSSDPNFSDDSLPLPSIPTPSKNLWKVAVNATKGLLHLNATTATAKLDCVHQKNECQVHCAMPWPECPQNLSSSSLASRISPDTKQLRKSRSSPSLKRGDRQHVARTYAPFPSTLSSASRRQKRAPTARPLISHPSLPYRLDSHSNPKLASPSLINLQSHKPYRTFSSSSLSITSSPYSPPTLVTESSSSKVTVHRDLNASRRRTKSASGLQNDKVKRLLLGSDALDLDFPPPSIYSPSFSTASSSSLRTPKTPAILLQDPYASPRSLSSVKRKPVPRHLYSEGMDIEASPLKPAPPSPHPQVPGKTNQFPNGNTDDLKSTRGDDVMSPPFGTRFTNVERKSGTSGHSRSISEFGVVRAPLMAWDGARFDCFAVESPALASCAHVLTPARKDQPLPSLDSMDSPSPARSSVRSDEESRNSALSPLTDEEIVAIRTFIKRHTAGQKARQRRQQATVRRQRSHFESQSESDYEVNVRPAPLATLFDRQRGSYSVNAEIFAAYLDQHDLALVGSVGAQTPPPESDMEQDLDADTDCASVISTSSERDNEVIALPRRSSSSPRTISRSRVRGHPLRPAVAGLEIDTNVSVGSQTVISQGASDASEANADIEDDSDASHRDELETPVDGSNRRTFGYDYGPEMVRLDGHGDGTVEAFDQRPHNASPHDEIVSPVSVKPPVWSFPQPPLVLGVSDSSADEREREYEVPASTSPLRIRKQASRSLSRHPAQSPRARLVTRCLGLLTRDSVMKPSLPVDSSAISSPPRRTRAETPIPMGIPILKPDELSLLESASEREAEEEMRGRRLRPGPGQRRSVAHRSECKSVPRNTQHVASPPWDGDLAFTSSFGRLVPPPPSTSSSAASVNESDDLALDGLSSSFERFQFSLSRLKAHAPAGGATEDVSAFDSDASVGSSVHSSTRFSLKPAVEIPTSPEARLQKSDHAPDIEDAKDAASRQESFLPPRPELVCFTGTCDRPGTPPALSASTSSTCTASSSSSSSATIASTRSFIHLTPNTTTERVRGAELGTSTARQTSSRMPLRRFFAGLKPSGRGKR